MWSTWHGRTRDGSAASREVGRSPRADARERWAGERAIHVTLRPPRPRGMREQGAPPSGRAPGGRQRCRIEWGADDSSAAWNFNFNNGKRNWNHRDNANNNRALCVRRSGA